MNNRFIKELLSDLAAGKLSAADAAEVRRHLAEDPRLEKFSAFLTRLQPLLRELGDDFPGLHLTGEEIVAEVLGPLQVGVEEPSTPERTIWVSNHLADCRECRDLVQVVQMADKESDAPTPVLAAKFSGSRTNWSRLAFAAVLLVVVVGAGLFIGQREQTPVLTPFRIEAVTRSADQLPAISLDATAGPPPLLLEFDPWVGRPDDNDFGLVITLEFRGQPSQTWSVERNAREGWQASENAFRLDWKLTGLQSGPYRIEAADTSGRVIFQGSFRLVPGGD